MEGNKGIVVSVGAGALQYEFIDRLKKRGYKVASFGKGRNSEEAIRRSDYFKEIDTSDANEAIKWLDSLNLPIHAIGSYAGGRAIETLQIIANHYKLATSIPENLIVGMNKIDQQVMYEKHGLSTILTYTYDDILKNKGVIDEKSQYIKKPAIGRGSSGIEFITGKDILRKVECKDLNAGDIIQTVVNGTEYRMLLMVQGGQIKLLAPIRRSSFRGTFLLGRLEVSFSDYDRIREHAKKMICNLGIRNAVIKYDIIVDSEMVNLIEMDIGVGGGTYFKKYVSMVMNTDLMETYIDLICDKEIPEIQCEAEKLIMDYVYNKNPYPVEYDLIRCKKEIGDMCGEVVLLQNMLHPERKGGIHSNADFLFTIIYEKKEINLEEINDYVNHNLLKMLI